MRVLWVGDAVVSSGFARCTHVACDALHAAGHEVHVLGINYFGDPHHYPYPIYPCRQPLDHGKDAMGTTRLPRMIQRVEPDVVVLLNDPWNIKPYLDSMDDRLAEDFPRPAVVGWLAVDGKNQLAEPLNRLDRVIVWTDFAARELKAGGYGGDPDIVPLGVDTAHYYPRNREESRARLLPASVADPSHFYVGVVGRNQPRKRLDLAISYFADWVTRFHRDDARLVMHIGPTGDVGVNLRSLVKYHGLAGRVILIEPDIGTGVDESAMPEIYSMLDVLISTTQGEGWGLPVLEAMACGVPCVVPDWSGLGSWARGAAVLVPCTSTAPTAPINGSMHTIGGIPDRREFGIELDNIYRAEAHRNAHSRRGLRLANSLQWSSTGAGVRRILEAVVQARAASGAAAPLPPSSGDVGAVEGKS